MYIIFVCRNPETETLKDTLIKLVSGRVKDCKLHQSIIY